ncbi:MAG: hypothetical protein HRT81_12215 [Henriciella sp.]|nr:hypothetical protein [Henriciella sp.]
MDDKSEKSPLSEQESESKRPDDARLEKLAHSLREKYADISDEPVPENLKQLIEELREAEKKAQTRH